MKRGDRPLLEVTLRKYERPSGERKNLARTFLLSIGLLQPGDSRDTVVDIFDFLMQSAKNREVLKVKEICSRLNQGDAPSNVRRHLRRLREVKLVEKTDGGYRIAEGFDLSLAFKYVTRKYIISDVLDRIEMYASALEEAY